MTRTASNHDKSNESADWSPPNGERCLSCEEISFPANGYCPSCGGDTENINFNDIKIETYSIIHVAPKGFETPYAAGFVRLFPGDIRTFAPIEVESFDQLEIGMDMKFDAFTPKGRQQTWGVTPLSGGEDR